MQNMPTDNINYWSKIMKTKHYYYVVIASQMLVDAYATNKRDAVNWVMQQLGLHDHNELICLGINLEERK
jgi:hypothetical protein